MYPGHDPVGLPRRRWAQTGDVFVEGSASPGSTYWVAYKPNNYRNWIYLGLLHELIVLPPCRWPTRPQ
jgi:hypothetical protein